MATLIKSTAVIADNGYSAIKNATQAGLACLEKSGVPANEVGLLINTGVYRDDNIMEPSIASLIQKDLSMGLDFNGDAPHLATLSFDVVNGACGFLNAVTVADSFLKNGTVRYALIICGDAHPSRTDHPEFPYVAVGAAALLHFDPNTEQGFQSFAYTSNDNELPSNANTYGNLENFADQGRSAGNYILGENRSVQFHALNLSLINSALERWNKPEVDFLLGSDIEAGYCNSICEHSQLSHQNTRAIDIYNLYKGDVHSAAPIAAFDQLLKEIPSPGGNKILFSCIGSGDASACALYQM